ncbi:unnamed protein product [Oppiella nova]|uniref:Uncharacterized protein n=1 Tax=Oppiella nova TaxID=334625 RepID=A0A7R9QQX5_9ACAR|nr:unnamed protein product [Oppiella nova]CAG2171023.1 unnamed protein product [Oppiella nova]
MDRKVLIIILKMSEVVGQANGVGVKKGGESAFSRGKGRTGRDKGMRRASRRGGRVGRMGK